MKFIAYIFFLIAFFSGGICALINNSKLPPQDIFSGQQKDFKNKGNAFCGVSSTINSDEIVLGKQLFKNHCATCHNRNMKDDMTGPALENVERRGGKYPKENLYSFIRNSQEMIGEGHPRALEVFEEWKVVMNPFPNLTNEDIENILSYIKQGERDIS